MSYYLDGPAKATPVIKGRGLALRKHAAQQKAGVAAQILKGEILVELSIGQVAKLVGVSVPYIMTALQLPRHHRAWLANGVVTFGPLPKRSTAPRAPLNDNISIAAPAPGFYHQTDAIEVEHA